MESVKGLSNDLLQSNRRPDGWVGLGGEFGTTGTFGIPVSSITGIKFGDTRHTVSFFGGSVDITCAASDLLAAIVKAQLEVRRTQDGKE